MKPLLSLLLLLTLSFTLAQGQEKTRILFIGNSYTGQVRGTVTKLFQASPQKDSIELEFVSPGGKTLAFHLENSSTVEKIKNGNWDYVVLQDQSQTPAVFPDKFRDAAVDLDKMIDQAGAMTVFYQTWGRRDGDKMNPKLFPDYKKMQKALSDSYESAARRCKARLAPVGDTWSEVRKADSALGLALYKKDGSHPSNQGAYLAACVFYATIFEKSPRSINFRGGLSDQEAETILEAVEKTLPSLSR